MATILDCGCHIYEGKRTWCPTCSSGPSCSQCTRLAAENAKLREEVARLEKCNAIQYGDVGRLHAREAKLRAAVRGAALFITPYGVEGTTIQCVGWLEAHAEAIRISGSAPKEPAP